MKVVIIVISVRFKISTFFGDSHVLSAKDVPWMEAILSLWASENASFDQNKNFNSIE